MPTKSELVRVMNGRPVEFFHFWASMASVACFTSDDVDKDFCSMISEALRFLRIGFFVRNELLFDIWLGGSEVGWEMQYLVAVCRGPYSHVTSQSFNLDGVIRKY